MAEKYYDHKKIEFKWQNVWEKEKVFEADDNSAKKKFYGLTMFPYPSGQGLHVGHPESYTALDIIVRYMKMKGYNIMNPIGWDAFGLPAENYAIQQGVPPRETTQENIKNFTKQIKSLGFSYDWSREINTSAPEYYKWTQWMFLQMYKHGLAYKKKAKVNWCESCKTVLANEQVIDNKCERCDSEVLQKDLEQWFFKITAYVEKLLAGLDQLDWPEPIKLSQKNWIGKSEGAMLRFKIKDLRLKNKKEVYIEVFTTRPDTIYGATYMVLAPEHELVRQLKSQITNWDEVATYIKEAQKKTELQRTDLAKEKTGVELKGVKTINPANQKEIPIYIADYVMMTYGTGAIMAVPAHDQRDFEFAKNFGLEIIPVIKSEKQKTVLILHGTEGHSKKNWYPWLKDELEKQGFNVIVPNMPDSRNPQLRLWLKHLQKIIKEISGEFIIIGHSLGCPTALQFIQNNKINVSKLYLIAPTHSKMDWQQIEETHEKGQCECIKKVTNAGYDASQINQLVKEIHLYLSEDDTYIPFNVLKLFQDLKPINHLYKNKGHFNKSTRDMVEFLDLLDELTKQAYEAEGKMINSDKFDGLDNKTAMKKITKKIGGKMQTQYRLRDWLISRQRYWGTPIPIIYCAQCGEVAVPEKDLPVKLPEDVDFKPTGESPLKSSKEFHRVKCPKCGQSARRESDTMDTFVCSSWYYLRYANPNNDSEPFSQKLINKWLPVDTYIGGAEHANGHLLFSRFFTKALNDFGYLQFDEPFLKLRNQGMILGEDNQKMSKSKGNVINPDEVIAEYGADTIRVYEMFMGPLEDSKPWSTSGIIGVRRFLEKVWLVIGEWLDNNKPEDSSNDMEKLFHQTIKKVTLDIETMKFNTAISAMMILVNQMTKIKKFKQVNVEGLLKILDPFAPHISEELWEKVSGTGLICQQEWPVWDETKIVEEEVEIAIQVNGRLRAKIIIPIDLDEEKVFALALDQNNVKKFTDNKEVIKKIYIPKRLVNIVIK